MPQTGQTPMFIRAFGGARMAVGALSWAAPLLAARVFGLDPASRQPIVTQLFGARDFALGLLTATTSGASGAQVLRLGVMIDAADTVASLRQMRQGALSTQAIVLVAAGAASFTAIGAVALAGERS
ncbi:MAG: hypothetical protein ABI950_02890 [Solirubrobacteraceae bacterium]